MRITRAKKDTLRRYYIAGQYDAGYLAARLELCQKTIRFYFNQFRIIEKEHPGKLADYGFFIHKEAVANDTQWYLNLMAVLPDLIAGEEGPMLIASTLYVKYARICPNQYAVPRFYYLFKRWFDKNHDALCAARLKEKFTPGELATLKRWRKSSDHHRWQVAVALMTVYTYNSMGKLADRIECTRHTLLSWLRIYRGEGLAGLDRPGNKRPIRPERVEEIKINMDNLVHMVMQPPKLYGIDRTSWCLTDLAFVFGREYGRTISHSTVSNYLKKRGIKYKRSREVIVSTDPLFREKYAAIQRILENLTENEKFFSIDEYGPTSVRPKGGRRLTAPGMQPVYQRVDKGKGWFICTCALELSTNHLTWFYSRSKDTNEMIKLIEVLAIKYKDQDKLYLSWDAASWHASRQLTDYLETINEPSYRTGHGTPQMVLAPLPARSPYLNVVESVFSGLSKSVIHNSDYHSVAECTAAIDRYFSKRNKYYLENPQRAGKKIWGKERVIPVFDKANVCKAKFG